MNIKDLKCLWCNNNLQIYSEVYETHYFCIFCYRYNDTRHDIVITKNYNNIRYILISNKINNVIFDLISSFEMKISLFYSNKAILNSFDYTIGVNDMVKTFNKLVKMQAFS